MTSRLLAIGTEERAMQAVRLGLALSLIVVSPAIADQFSDGQAAYSRSDYATAYQLWKPLADEGDARAENMLGNLYDTGQGVKQDIEEAFWTCSTLVERH